MGDYINVKHGYAFKGEFFSVTETKDILLTPGNFNIGGGFKYGKLKFYNGEYPKEYILSANDIIVTMTDLSVMGDTLGFPALVPTNENKRFLHNQRIGLVQFINQEIWPFFIYWRLRNMDYHNFVIGRASGSTVKHTSPTSIRSFPFKLPPLSQQKSIANTLSCLDDKIELNNKINDNLEQQAQAIFKSWFVDFEPFQDGEFEESELGMIPKGWRVGSLFDIAEYLNGLAMQKFRPSEEETGIPVLKIKELRQGSCDNSSELCSESVRRDYIVNDGDVIFSWSGSLLVDFWCGGKSGLNQHLFKVTSKKYDKWFYYLWTNFHLQKFIGIAAAKATTMGHIKREDLASSKVFIPDEATYQTINSVIKPIYELLISNRIENRKLANVRNELLPKLMSGEIEVANTPVICG